MASNHVFEQEVASRAEDLQFLDDKKLQPFVSEDGRLFTTISNAADFPQGPEDFLRHNPRVQALISVLQAETSTEEGRRVLVAAFKRYEDLKDLREEHPE